MTRRRIPFLTAELDCISQRIAAQKPTLGICLGAQLMAASMGARVYPGDQGPEIGWYPIYPPADAVSPQWFKPLFHFGLHLFHWHGDTFDLPVQAMRLAETQLYPNQAFSVGDFALFL